MPTFRVMSRTVNLASPSMISFILETISLRDADFGLPDFGAFLMDSTPDSAGLGGSVGCAVRLETRRSRVQPPPRSATFFRGG